MRRSYLKYIFTAVAVFSLLIALAGCGEDEEEVSVACDVEAESIIPAPSGKPQHVYFYSPT